MIYKNGKKVSELYIAGKKVLEVYSNGQLVYRKSTPTPTLGPFTINSNGDRIKFAPGNLQYQASTGLWRFAEHQYDYIGNSLGNNASNSIRPTQSDWIDLFGFGCNGENNGQINYMPYSNSNYVTDYYSAAMAGNSSFSYQYNLQTGENWRMLEKSDWKYIMYTRNGHRYAKASINGINGLVVFPDNYTSNLNNINTPASSYSSNILTIQDYTQLEADGCVFLPTSGCAQYYNNSLHFYDMNSKGYYYVGNLQSIDSYVIQLFSDGSNFSSTNYAVSADYAVRLVQDIPSN